MVPPLARPARVPARAPEQERALQRVVLPRALPPLVSELSCRPRLRLVSSLRALLRPRMEVVM